MLFSNCFGSIFSLCGKYYAFFVAEAGGVSLDVFLVFVEIYEEDPE